MAKERCSSNKTLRFFLWPQRSLKKKKVRGNGMNTASPVQFTVTKGQAVNVAFLMAAQTPFPGRVLLWFPDFFFAHKLKL